MNSNTLRALFIGISDSRAAALSSAFHRLGYVCRHIAADEMGALGNAIRNDKPDLLLFDADNAAIELPQCLEAIGKNSIDLPVIALSNKDELLPDHSIADVLATDSAERIARSCLREFWALQTRRALANTQAQLEAAEARSELILSQSDDAIAYVADGMIVDVNKLFAQTFGFDDPDELDCQPIVDLISDDDQERLKNALRGVQHGETGSTHITVTGRCPDGREVTAPMSLAASTLDGEDCIQLTIREEGAGAGAGDAGIDPVTGFASAERFLLKLDDIASHGFGGAAAEGALLLISIDRYAELRAEHGFTGAVHLVRDLAELLKVQLPQSDFGCLDNDIVGALVSGCNAEAALAQAKTLCKAAASRSIDLDEHAFGYSVSIGVAPIGSGKVPPAGQMLDACLGVCEELRQNSGGNDAALYVRARQQLNETEDPHALLEDAKTDKRLELLFQPIVSLADEDHQYYEVFLSLKDRQAEEISAEQLIDAFEAEGQSTELDRWIIVEATKQLAPNFGKSPKTRLVINLSANVVVDKGLVPWLGVALKAAQLPADTLVLQMRARSLARITKPAKAFADKLRKLGADIAVKTAQAEDDATLIKQLQPRMIKLDQGIDNAEALGRAIGAVQEAGSKALVAGVESAATLATLWQLKPDYVQGAYVHSPSRKMDYDFGED